MEPGSKVVVGKDLQHLKTEGKDEKTRKGVYKGPQTVYINRPVLEFLDHHVCKDDGGNPGNACREEKNHRHEGC